MNLLELYATLSLDTGEYEDGVEGAKGHLEGLSAKAVAVGTMVADAVEAIAKKSVEVTTALVKGAVEGYATYEQLSGGVKKLFDNDMFEASATVEKNAQNAFKTAGLSANAYLETVTSFSASLISGLEGDTERAAKLADVAIGDMADNANTFGSSIESIQNAYNGFAKGNFTMLDNLKLGYGGTAGEMVRLMNDSGVLKEKIESLDGISFAQMIEAIHAVQEDMGIYGTTSKEAMTTIEGSINATKASWDNLLTGLARGDQDLTELLDTLFSNATAVAKNVVPAVERTFGSMKSIVDKFAPTIMEQVKKKTPQFVKTGIETAKKLIDGLGDGIRTNMPTFFENALPLILKFSEKLKENAGVLITAGLELLLNVAKGFADSIPAFVSYVPQIIINIANIINENAPKLIVTGVSIVLTLIQGIIKAIPDIVKSIPKLIEAIVSVWTAFNWINLGKTVVQNIVKGIKNLPSMVKGLFTKAKTSATTSIKSLPSAVKSVFNAVKTAIQNPLKSAQSVVNSIFNAMKSGITTKINGAKNAVTSAVSKIKSAMNFSWSLPKLKMPHVSIDGHFSLNPPSVPKFSISWYRKAMDSAYMLDGAQIFGAMGGNMLGGGEAGRELIVGEDYLKRITGGGDNGEIVAMLNKIYGAINKGLVYVVTPDEKKLFDTMVAANNKYKTKTGRSAFA